MIASRARALPVGGAHSGLEGVPGSAVGRVVGSYLLEEYLGCGGMADVYAATSSSGPVAIKRMLPMRTESGHWVELFLHEARVLSQISHPNLPRCIDFGIADGVPYLAMAYVDGVSCELLLRGLAGTHGAFPPAIALAITHQVLLGLTAVHEARGSDGRRLGFVHQDVSSDNVLLGRNGTVTLIDFGIAQSHDQDRAGAASEARGKLGYMSPEQILGERIDARSDVFATGAFLAELLLGQRLFGAPTSLGSLVRASRSDTDELGDLEVDVSPGERGLILQALALRPAQRFRTARAFDRQVRAVEHARGAPVDAQGIAAWLETRGVPPSVKRRPPRMPTPAVGNLAARIDAVDATMREQLGDGRQPPASAHSSGCRPVAAASHYRLRQVGSHEERPQSLADLVERVATGSVLESALVAVGGAAPVATGEVPALSTVARASRARFDGEAGRAPRWRCSLERSTLPGMLFMLAATRATGVLSARAGARRKLIHLDAGSPCFVASSEPAELIGAQLVARGILSKEQRDLAVGRATLEQRPIGEVLVEMRVLSASGMLRRLVAQLDTRVLELGSWVEGELAFTAGLRPASVIPRSMGVPGEIACRLARTRYCDDEIDDFLRGLASRPLTRTPERSWAEQPLPLLEVEVGILAAAARSGEIEALTRCMQREHAVPPADTRRAVFLGLSAGLLASPGWPSPLGMSGLGTHR